MTYSLIVRTSHLFEEKYAEAQQTDCRHGGDAMNFRAVEEGCQVSAWATFEEVRWQHRPALPIDDGVILTSRFKIKSSDRTRFAQ